MPMKIRNTTSVFVSSIIAMLVLGLIGIGSSVAISQSFAQANDTNAITTTLIIITITTVMTTITIIAM